MTLLTPDSEQDACATVAEAAARRTPLAVSGVVWMNAARLRDACCG